MIEISSQGEIDSSAVLKRHQRGFLYKFHKIFITVTFIGSTIKLFEISIEILFNNHMSFIYYFVLVMQIFCIIYSIEKFYTRNFEYVEKTISIISLVMLFIFITTKIELFFVSRTNPRPRVVIDISSLFYIMNFFVFVIYIYDLFYRFTLWIERRFNLRPAPDEERSK